MSTLNSPAGAKKEDGLDRLVKRMKTVFRRKKSKPDTTSTAAPAAGGSGTPAPAASAEKPTTATATEVPATAQKRPENRIATQRERAQALFAKYGLELRDDEWIVSTVSPMERVEKPIRMRVRRQCHKCQTTFGADKACSNCNHHKCKDCPRIPPKKNKNKGKATIAAAAVDADKAKAKRKEQQYTLTIPSKTGGQDLVRKPLKQRTRRFCHKCNTIFLRNATECSECQHVRCKRCPRDPAKSKKWPDGYPGDVDPESDETADPAPIPPKEQEKETSPGLMKSVQDKIANLGIQGDEPGGS